MASLSTRSTRGFPDLDLDIGGRRFLRLTGRRAGLVYGRFTVLRAHPGGAGVRRAEVRERPWLWLGTVCGALICTRRGSVLVQFRAWPR